MQWQQHLEHTLNIALTKVQPDMTARGAGGGGGPHSHTRTKPEAGGGGVSDTHFCWAVGAGMLICVDNVTLGIECTSTVVKSYGVM
jgi:hypothetical protein